MSHARAGSAQPLHPDQYGALARVLILPRLEFWDAEAPLTDAEMAAMWAEEEVWRDDAARPHYHGCGHLCTSGACVLMAGMNDYLCMACQLAEVSDNERHLAERRAREKSA